MHNLMTSEPLDPAAIAAKLGTTALPRTVRCYHTVGSTMDVARELLAENDVHLPLLVVADEQTAGRGRLGRRWQAEPGAALLLSLALRPSWLAPERAVALLWMTATALCEAVEELSPLRPVLKWPNDLLLPWGHPAWRIHGGSETKHQLPDDPASSSFASGHSQPAQAGPRWRKAAGILLEVSANTHGIERAIIGCGINVSAAPPFTATRYPAVSLAEAGAPLERLALLRTLLRRLDAWHNRLVAGDEEALWRAWRARLITLGQEVRIETGSEPLVGLAEDVERGGALLVRDKRGALHQVAAGDVG